jgi:uncharacterized membrane protein YhaH (DUF805 family)
MTPHKRSKGPSIWSAVGRINRMSYVKVNLSTAIIALVLGMFPYESPEAVASHPYVAWTVYLAYLALTFVAVVAGIKRLHDLDRTGWWILLMMVPLVNLILGVFLTFRRGQDHANRFGPPPGTAPAGTAAVGAAAGPHRDGQPAANPAEEPLWAQALHELDHERRSGLWARCFAESKGNEAQARAAYLQERVLQLRGERPATP